MSEFAPLDPQRIVGALAAHGVRYVLIGALAGRLQGPEPGYRITTPVVRMDDKIDHVLSVLSDRKRVEFTSLVAPWGTRMHAVMSLLACLELAKRSSLNLRQTGPFAPLWVYRREGEADAA